MSWIQPKGWPIFDFSFRKWPFIWVYYILLQLFFFLRSFFYLFSHENVPEVSQPLLNIWRNFSSVFQFFMPSANTKAGVSRHSAFKSTHGRMSVSALMLYTKHPNQILQYLWIHEEIISNFFTSHWAGWVEDLLLSIDYTLERKMSNSKVK